MHSKVASRLLGCNVTSYASSVGAMSGYNWELGHCLCAPFFCQSIQLILQAKVCLTCGDAGFPEALVYCIMCKSCAVHRYCLPTVILRSDVDWLCDDCEPRIPISPALRETVHATLRDRGGKSQERNRLDDRIVNKKTRFSGVAESSFQEAADFREIKSNEAPTLKVRTLDRDCCKDIMEEQLAEKNGLVGTLSNEANTSYTRASMPPGFEKYVEAQQNEVSIWRGDVSVSREDSDVACCQEAANFQGTESHDTPTLEVPTLDIDCRNGSKEERQLEPKNGLVGMPSNEANTSYTRASIPPGFEKYVEAQQNEVSIRSLSTMEQCPRPCDYVGHDRTPESRELLNLHDFHRAKSVWEKEARKQPGDKFNPSLNDTMRIRRCKFIPGEVQNNQRFQQLMFQSGFGRCWQMGYLPHADNVLVTALVERWRPETHTFHMPQGEMSITLQDVMLLLHLPILGIPVTGEQVPHNWGELCLELIGKDPTACIGGSKGNKISLHWLMSQFDATALTEDTSNEVVEQYVRANILLLIGSQLFPDKDDWGVKTCWLPMLKDLNSIFTYSWGGACLAFLYKQLCLATKPNSKNIGGATHLLCMWAWQRFRPTCPIFHKNEERVNVTEFSTIRWSPDIKMRRAIKTMSEMRRVLEELQSAEIIWRPYDAEVQLMEGFGPEIKGLWRARVPLICFADVEWHYPDRVLRQFGMAQDIPKPPEPHEGIHASDFRGTSKRNWALLYKDHVKAWTEWMNHVVNGAPQCSEMHYHHAYMDWYRRVTIRFMTIRGAAQSILADAVERMWQSSQSEQLRRIAESALGAAGEQHHYRDFPSSQEVYNAQFNADYVIRQEEKEPRGRKKRTLISGRRQVESVQPISCVSVMPPLHWTDYMTRGVYPNMAGTSSQSHFVSRDGRTYATSKRI